MQTSAQASSPTGYQQCYITCPHSHSKQHCVVISFSESEHTHPGTVKNTKGARGQKVKLIKEEEMDRLNLHTRGFFDEDKQAPEAMIYPYPSEEEDADGLVPPLCSFITSLPMFRTVCLPNGWWE